MQFDRGYISPYFITDPDHMQAEIEDAYVLVYDKKISAAADIVPLLEKLVQVGKRELLIIAEDIDGEASGDPRPQQTSWHAECFGCQGSGIWRSPQGYACRISLS